MFTAQRTAQERLREVEDTILDLKNNDPTQENQNLLLRELGKKIKLEHMIAKKGHVLLANPVPVARKLFKKS